MLLEQGGPVDFLEVPSFFGVEEGAEFSTGIPGAIIDITGRF